MDFYSADLKSLHDLYLNQLRTLLSAEEQLTEALAEMIDKASDTQLKQAFQSHLQETHVQVTRLENILASEGPDTQALESETLTVLVEEARDLIADCTDDSVRDDALIAAAQRVEHYEIVAYGVLRHWAYILGKSEQAQLLDQTIKEELHADHLLTAIANRINVNAEKAA